MRLGTVTISFNMYFSKQYGFVFYQYKKAYGNERFSHNESSVYLKKITNFLEVTSDM